MPVTGAPATRKLSDSRPPVVWSILPIVSVKPSPARLPPKLVKLLNPVTTYTPCETTEPSACLCTYVPAPLAVRRCGLAKPKPVSVSVSCDAASVDTSAAVATTVLPPNATRSQRRFSTSSSASTTWGASKAPPPPTAPAPNSRRRLNRDALISIPPCGSTLGDGPLWPLDWTAGNPARRPTSTYAKSVRAVKPSSGGGLSGQNVRRERADLPDLAPSPSASR